MVYFVGVCAVFQRIFIYMHMMMIIVFAILYILSANDC